jgi:NADPH-dependent 2,4-dienoyl-CoA reductase/sulfur reductase-like enzyme
MVTIKGGGELLLMIEEYARHNGHADLLREVIDGVVGT